MQTFKVEFEGTDGAGKTTGLTYFIEQAKQRGLTVKETREVGNPNVPSCVELRKFVLDPKNNLSGEAMEFIFSAMRYENDRWYKQLTASANAPDLVVSDRGWFSHLSYTDHNVSKDFTNKLYMNILKQETLLPNIVIYFNVSTDTALARRIKRGEGMADAIEIKGIAYQELVRSSFADYLNEADTEGKITIFDVDANDTIEGVRSQLDAILNKIEILVKNSKAS